jgi:peptidoglycan/LPS O-acetylase OafA/YrhL
MTQRRFAGLDIMRGIAIMAIIIVHRAHYSWSGMQNRAILGKYFASPWAPLVILAIALFTMAGVFYVISGLVNAYALQ